MERGGAATVVRNSAGTLRRRLCPIRPTWGAAMVPGVQVTLPGSYDTAWTRLHTTPRGMVGSGGWAWGLRSSNSVAS